MITNKNYLQIYYKIHKYFFIFIKKSQKTRKKAFSSCFGGQARDPKKGPFFAFFWTFIKVKRGQKRPLFQGTGGGPRSKKKSIFHDFLTFLQIFIKNF